MTLRMPRFSTMTELSCTVPLDGPSQHICTNISMTCSRPRHSLDTVRLSLESRMVSSVQRRDHIIVWRLRSASIRSHAPTYRLTKANQSHLEETDDSISVECKRSKSFVDSHKCHLIIDSVPYAELSSHSIRHYKLHHTGYRPKQHRNSQLSQSNQHPRRHSEVSQALSTRGCSRSKNLSYYDSGRYDIYR